MPSLLVFGVLPSLPSPNTRSPDQVERFHALRTAKAELEQIVAEKRISTALRSKLPPATKYLIKPGDQVRVYREQTRKWEGPFTVHRTTPKIISVTDGRKVKQFNISSVLPIAPQSNDADLKHDMEMIDKQEAANVYPTYVTEVIKKSDTRYKSKESKDAIQLEITRLLNRKAFAFVNEKEIPPESNILGGRIILAIKNPNTPTERYKARFIVQGHKDREKEFLIHTSKTIRYKNIRLILTISAAMNFEVWSQDVTQAYIQGENLSRTVYVRPTPDFELPENSLLKLLKPLYGLSESGDAWFQRYNGYLTKNLKLEQTDGDMSCYYKREEEEELQGLLGVYVDDTLAAGSEKFKKLTDNIEKHFESKPREYLPFQFAGINIKKKENGFIMEQQHYVSTISKLEKSSTFETFRTTRHRLAWISHTRPEILAGVNILAQVTKDTFQQEDITITNSLIKHIHKNPELGLQYNKMDIETMEILVYSDGSFSGNNDGSSQVGFMNFLIDKNNTASLIEYSSSKSKRIVRSVLGAETFGMADACDP